MPNIRIGTEQRHFAYRSPLRSRRRTPNSPINRRNERSRSDLSGPTPSGDLSIYFFRSFERSR
jgi:hypothetical protein